MLKTSRGLMILSASIFWAGPLSAQSSGQDAGELARMRQELAVLAGRIDQLEAELADRTSQTSQTAQVETATTTSTTDSRPMVASLEKSDGWSFTPKGRLMFDAGWIDAPDSVDADDGFGSEARRVRLGAAGTVPGGFGYALELEFAGDQTEVMNAYLSYERGPVEIIVGQQNPFQSLEELSSSLHTSFIERSAFTDAFGFERRIGASVVYANAALLAEAGVFADNIQDSSSGSHSVDGRLVFMPKAGGAQLHFGGSLHYNEVGNDAADLRYRQRPFLHFASERFIDTGALHADSETGMGLEFAAISGRFHTEAEGYWQSVDLLGEPDDADFFGGSIEAGVFLTNDTRGYSGGKFERVKPSEPLGKGGFGSVQFNVRYDYLDLNDATVVGGQQTGYQASLIWKPTAYTALMIDYGHLDYEDAVIATASGDTSYGVDAVGMRAQIDF